MDVSFLQMGACYVFSLDLYSDSVVHITLCPKCKKPAVGYSVGDYCVDFDFDEDE